LGVGGSEAQCHGRDVLQEGWSWKKASDATAIEKPPPPFDKADVQFNNDIVDKSAGLIPPLTVFEIESIGGSHTNTFLRQVKNGVRCVVQSLADEHGALNAEKLCLRRPLFKEALDKGMKWYLLHWAAAFVWPQLLSFIQSALNTVSRGGQSETEMMLQMCDAAKAAIRAKQNPDWDRIVANAKASMPPCSPYMRTLANYVQLNTEGELLQDLNDFLKAFACNEDGPLRVLGGEYIAKVASLNWGKSVKYPFVQNACLMTNLSSPKVSDGVCKLIAPSSLSALLHKDNLAKVHEADQLMQDARKLCKELGIRAAVRTHALGKLDTRCILHIVKKAKDAGDIEFDNLNAIAAVRHVYAHSRICIYMYIYIYEHIW